MVFISVTRLHLRSFRYLPMFLWHTYRSTRQVTRSPGFIAGRLMTDTRFGFWTVTAWDEETLMRSYRNTNAHKQAMPKLLHWCNEASIVHWQQDDAMPPNFQTAYRRMVEEGRMSKVRNPSPTQAAKQIPQVNGSDRFGQALTPKAAKG